jgi:hypothetical protein
LTGGRRASVMPTQVGIHVFMEARTVRRGWRAFARHDDGDHADRSILRDVGIIRACRDPKDDNFRKFDVGGGAGVIITGDADLLALHPFRGVEIVIPVVFLSRSR